MKNQNSIRFFGIEFPKSFIRQSDVGKRIAVFSGEGTNLAEEFAP
jgi:hypothetical protein